MRVLFVLEQLNIGGPQKSLIGLLENIDKKNVSVDVILLQDKGQLIQYVSEKANLRVAPKIISAFTFPSYDIIGSLKEFYSYGGVRLFLGGIAVLVRHTLLRTNMNIERQRFWNKYSYLLPKDPDEYDIAFGYSPTMSTYYVKDCIKAIKKCHWVRCDYRIMDLDRDVEKECFDNMDGIVAVSKMTAEIFTKIFPSVKNKTTYYYNYIPEQYYNSLPIESLNQMDKGRIKIITVTRIDKLKGIELIFDACSELQNKINFVWYIVGDGKDKDCFQRAADRKGVAKNIVFTGFKKNIYSCLKQCDIFVLPSRTEGKSNAVDEAKQIGIPVIVTNYPTAREQIVTGENGLIADFSGKSIAENILKICSDSSLKEKIIVNCKNEKVKRERPDELFSRIMRGQYAN